MARERLLVMLSVGLLLWQASDAAAQEGPIRAREAYARAVALEREGNDSAALPLLWQAAGLAPRDADVQNRLGEALARLGALDAAVDAFARAVAERPTFHKASNNLILALVQAGRGAEAVEQARMLVAKAPSDPERRFTLGLALAEQDVEAAIETFRRVLELNSRHVLARYNLGLALQRVDRLPEAIEQLRRALEIEPRPEVLYGLGVIYWHQGKLDDAASSFRAAIELQPSHAAAHSSLGTVLKDRRDWNGAAAALRKAITLQPDLPGPYVTLARVLQSSGDEAGARARLGEAERLRLQAQQAHEALVWTAVGTGKLDAGKSTDAVDDFRRAIATYEAYAPAHYQLGRALVQLGAAEAAQAAFARARQLNSSLVPPPDRP